jgi:hypothetical protein
MNRQKIKGKTYNSIINYDMRVIISTKNDIVNSVQAYNDRKLSKEETLNNLQLILNKIDAKINSSFTTN